MQSKKTTSVQVTVAIGLLLLGFWLRGFFGSHTPHRGTGQHDALGQEETPARWTCSMHPEIDLPKAGPCPKCGMALIPLIDDGGPDDLPQLRLSDSAAKLMDIQVVPVERRFVTATIRMVGRVDFDETRLSTIAARIPGRLDRLFVDYTGVPVKKGDHLVSLYSPELLSAQVELLQALKSIETIRRSESTLLRQSTAATLEAAREKLRLWGLTDAQVAEIEERGTASDHMTIYAATGGIVVHKNAVEGMYVQEGTQIYTIADLSTVWIKLDAYESDLQWLRYGQPVEFSTVSYPGQVFKGTIAFIDPVLDGKTRTVKIRVNVPNADGRLKPDMFVTAVVHAQVAAGGKVMDAALSGKWICRMHPDIIKEAAGACDLCEMPLVTTESLGYVDDALAQQQAPLVIPASAALRTGTRAVVYVKDPEAERPTFSGREVTLGPRAGDHYLVRDGLREGELVVVQGNFKIDAELQIQAKPSMMSLKPEVAPATAATPAARQPALKPELIEQLAPLFTAYFSMQQALAADDPNAAILSTAGFSNALKQVDMALFGMETHRFWMRSARSLEDTMAKVTATTDIVSLREHFLQVSQVMIGLSQAWGPLGTDTAYVMHCPMAFDNQGGDWLQDNDALLNPYFGATMLHCGWKKSTIEGK